CPKACIGWSRWGRRSRDLDHDRRAGPAYAPLGAVGGPTGHPATAAHDDRSAQRRRCTRRSRRPRGGIDRPDIAECVAARLAYGGGVAGFFLGHGGHHYASTALRDPMTKAFLADIHGFVAARVLEL